MNTLTKILIATLSAIALALLTGFIRNKTRQDKFAKCKEGNLSNSDKYFTLPTGEYSKSNPFGKADYYQADYEVINQSRMDALNVKYPGGTKMTALHEPTGKNLSASAQDFMLTLAQLRDSGHNQGIIRVPKKMSVSEYNAWANRINNMLSKQRSM